MNSIDMEFQDLVLVWCLECFGQEITASVPQRNFRFLKEALELVQANGMSLEDVTKVMAYVWARPKGKVPQEVAGTIVTLAALCNAGSIDIASEAMLELYRIQQPEMIARIRAKQAAKPNSVGGDKTAVPYGFMEVDVDGKVEHRAIAYFDTGMSRRAPALNEGETVQWIIGQDMPIIFKGKQRG